MVDDTTNLTSWFLSEDDEIQSFNGVELSKRNESLVVSFNTGIITVIAAAAPTTATTLCHKKTSSSAVAERRRDASRLSVVSFSSTIPRAPSFTSASDLQLRRPTIKFCSLLFSSAYSFMLQAVINKDSLMCCRLCDKLHGRPSQLLLVCLAAFVDRFVHNGDLCLFTLT